MRNNFLFMLAIIFAVSLSFCDVAENTGDMFLNENLFTVQCNSISLPINLSYKSGIRVNQRASWVGLGFDMSVPYIERTPVGSADEKAGSSTCMSGTHLSIKNYNKLLLPTSNGYSGTPSPSDFASQQDVYTLNAPFANGRIIFAQPAGTGKMNAYLQNWRALAIDYEIVTTQTGADIIKWTIIG
jgi:hypothetical protein